MIGQISGRGRCAIQCGMDMAEAEQAYEKAKNNPLNSAFSPLFQLLPGERRPRRYAGYNLPRSRYFALCEVIHSALSVSDLLIQHLERRYPRQDLGKLARIGADLS